MPKMKFKVGDRVKILPSATTVGVWASEVGKIGKITRISGLGDSLLIKMDKNEEREGYTWSVKSYQITIAKEIGQQLLLWE